MATHRIRCPYCGKTVEASDRDENKAEEKAWSKFNKNHGPGKCKK